MNSTRIFEEIEISQIDTEGRYRRDAGDINGMVESIKNVGLLQPVVVVRKPLAADGRPYRLVAGWRRLLALAELGRTSVPAYVASDLDDAAALLRAERDENTCRKDLAPSEAVALGKALEDLER